jgi:hypothetical protein
MRNLAGFCFMFTLLLSPSTYAQQERQLTLESSNSERRVALVIGNSAYEVAPLKNPVNDARNMAQTLAALGFEVIHREDLSQKDMKRAIRDFGARIRNGGIGLFYYAGHGVQVKGVNYLVPVDAKVESEEEVEYECVDAGFVLAQMETARNSMNIMILDACRNNPFVRSFRSASGGLAQMDAPSGTLIAYATAPGSVASDGNAQNGIYTQELLKFMRTEDLSIEEVFKRVRISVRNLTQDKQTPWESSSLTGDFHFNRGGAPINPARLPSTPSIDPLAIELAYWDTIKNSTDPEDFRIYLEKYPDGQFKAIAKRRIQTRANVTPPATSVNEAEIEQAVTALTTLGSSRIDFGKFGEEFTSINVVGRCQIKFAERALWNSKARAFKPSVSETTISLSEVNIAGIAVTEFKPPDRPSLWIVTARTIQGRAFTTSITGYENRSLEKVKVPTKTGNPTSALVAVFMDYESANRYAKAFATAARSCGAKSETF